MIVDIALGSGYDFSGLLSDRAAFASLWLWLKRMIFRVDLASRFFFLLPIFAPQHNFKKNSVCITFHLWFDYLISIYCL